MQTKIFTQQLAGGITLIDSGYMEGDIAAIYLMQQAGQCAIIETGTSHSVAVVLDVLESRNIQPGDVAYIIPTHVHLDHAGGAGELMHHCKNASLVIHPYGARHMIDPGKLEAGTRAVYGDAQFQALYGALRPVDESRIIEAPDNFTLDFNGRELTFLDTPGHARHHFCIYDKQTQGIFTGDTFGLCYPQLNSPDGTPFIFATTTPVQFDPDALLASIDRLIALKPKSIYLTHFGNIKPTSSLVKQLKNSIQTFVRIALENKDAGHQRIEKIQHAILHYLLDELHKTGCKLPRKQCEQLLGNDTLLNAQGLDVWLSRQ
jgi:glyoxylase-like metal-dependent hydrolase (beta-lactamase superfamily II)